MEGTIRPGSRGSRASREEETNNASMKGCDLIKLRRGHGIPEDRWPLRRRETSAKISSELRLERHLEAN